jgi:NAD(P)-dependent dehydrogenase (short-subunit alcohol dehydrogenase family)
MLENKKIVIIGGTRGLGFSAAKAFIAHGAKLIVTSSDSESVEMAQQIFGHNCLAIFSDAIEEKSADDAIAACIKRYGDFDGLYHVAGGSGRKYGDGPLHELTLEGWNKTLELNLTSLMLSNKAAISKLLELNKGGSILNMGSVLGYAPSPEFFATHAYAAAKSAIIGFSKSIAAYYTTHNIRINVIAPGLVETPMSARAVTDEDIVGYIEKKQALDGGRVGQPSDLDGLSTYFMSDLSAFTTGQVVAVDGGWSVG